MIAVSWVDHKEKKTIKRICLGQCVISTQALLCCYNVFHWAILEDSLMLQSLFKFYHVLLNFYNIVIVPEAWQSAFCSALSFGHVNNTVSIITPWAWTLTSDINILKKHYYPGFI